MNVVFNRLASKTALFLKFGKATALITCFARLCFFGRREYCKSSGEMAWVIHLLHSQLPNHNISIRLFDNTTLVERNGLKVFAEISKDTQ